MNLSKAFKLHPGAKIADPDAPGVKTLLECLCSQVSIQTAHSPTNPIRKVEPGVQWLDCQTSGSTGQPKTIRRAPASWQASFELARNHFGACSGDHYAVLGSIGYSLSLFAALEALHLGATLSVLAGRSPRDQFRTITSRSVSVIYATPTQLRQLAVAAPKGDNFAIGTVRTLLVGGGKFLASDREVVSRMFPRAEVIEFYGTSETSFVTIAKGTLPSGSVGRPYPAVEVKIDREDAQSCYGEVCVRSPYLAEKYLDSDNLLTRPDGFVSTGEIGYLDGAGYLFLKGRKDRMFTVSDINVFPEAIEDKVIELESVESCIVVPVPDTMRGNRFICFVKPASPDIELSQIRRHCRRMLGKGHVPSEIRVLSDFPELPSGKLDLQALRKMA